MTSPRDPSRDQLLIAAFRMPSVQTMMSRKSSITNAFVSAIIPTIFPTADEIEQVLSMLKLDPLDLRCAYCGDTSSEWDHLRPLVVNRRPTGYISEIANLVPSCGKCNQSKGNKPWREWMLSNAKRSPTGRGVSSVLERIARLETFEVWRTPTIISFETIIGIEEWAHYWTLCEDLIGEMRKCQEVADSIRLRVAETVRKQSSSRFDP
jgi:hypothetical protein